MKMNYADDIFPIKREPSPKDWRPVNSNFHRYSFAAVNRVIAVILPSLAFLPFADRADALDMIERMLASKPVTMQCDIPGGFLIGELDRPGQPLSVALTFGASTNGTDFPSVTFINAEGERYTLPALPQTARASNGLVDRMMNYRVGYDADKLYAELGGDAEPAGRVVMFYPMMPRGEVVVVDPLGRPLVESGFTCKDVGTGSR